MHSLPRAALLSSLLFATACSTPFETAAPTPQRPRVSSDTNLTAVGTIELESGVSYESGVSFDTPSALKLGLSETTELFVGFSPQRSTDVPGPNPRGAGDVVVGSRMRVLEDGDFAAAVQLATRLPGGNGGDSGNRGESDFFIAGILGNQYDDLSVTGFYQLGLIGERDSDSIFAEHTVALAAGAPASETVVLFGEVAGIFRPDLDSNAILATTGASWAWAPNLTLDGAVLIGLTDEAPDYQVLFGLTWNLGGFLPSSRGAELGRTAEANRGTELGQ
jgi:hypothetical protein